MKTKTVRMMTDLAALMAAGVTAQAQFTYTPLAYPLPVQTSARGISGANIVEFYMDTKGREYGFLYDGGTNWTSLNDPLSGPGSIGLTAANQPARLVASASGPAAIPFEQLGAVARRQHSRDGLAIASSPEGATRQCVFQRLNAGVTTEGLWLVSTKEGAKGEPFRIVARALRRVGAGLLHPGGMPENKETCAEDNAPPAAVTLPLSGKVELAGQVARFIRPGLTEEYSVSLDGVQQDFVIERPPPGNGSLYLDLEVDGAKAEAMPGGTRLVLADGGRQMAYSQLKAEDAQGRELTARLEVASAHCLAAVVDDAAAEYPVRIDPTFSDANWVSLGGLPGVNGQVNALAVDSVGNFYVGGAFIIGGHVQATNVAEWNGSSWSALGSGIDGSVSALAVSGTNLYAGGSFDAAGGVWATNIARWNGSSWSALGLGTDGPVSALTVSGTNLYAGGSFDAAGGVSATNIARWNGSSWSALGSGVGGDSSGGEVSALAFDGSVNLYAGGTFDTAGGVWASNIAKWDGSSWAALGSGLNSGDKPGSSRDFPWSVSALALDSAGNLYVGGNFTTAGARFLPYLAKALLTGPTPSQLLLANAGGGANVLTYLGTSGANYALDLATNLAPPVNWIPQTTNTASTANLATAGYVTFTNLNHLPGAYYRTRAVP